jgi:transcription termination/antitermination protein NusG
MKNVFDEMLEDFEAEQIDDAQDDQKVTVLEPEVKEKAPEPKEEFKTDSQLYVIRTTANREDQVFDFLQSNVERKKIPIYSIVRTHGMRGYIFIEAPSIVDAQHAIFGVPYARGILPSPVAFHEIEHTLETVKQEVNIRKNDVAEIISGPFKREKCKVVRVDKQKEEVVVELLEAAVSIPITLKFDALKVIRRDEETGEETAESI